ncbi:hypothetical protein Gasu2_31400 [Galdieria sulphuraria]|uniref:RING-type domain-containing protein n=1 Tax=Galdieria sulphuraria TaxID=130081 RepID=M2VY89_GALSU|nr:uncharacterized protein Gasu_42560 [Galdieria sulphuraria]EME28256.1 hypothetical protein Gasu_42560 [Galdieria sulphuraria]GJD08859.1 hypothetical protein Gasu2_31400 [Galdieria sulphuraria]|eukprot:XP_005704776.1 hypothetical protein Gasu_42560 [Galdieria sulphuraria]
MGNASSTSVWDLSSNGSLGPYYMNNSVPRSDRLLYMRNMFSRSTRSRRQRNYSTRRGNSTEEPKLIPTQFYLEESTFVKLIKNKIVAPRYKGSEVKSEEYRLECPICFYYYPALNYTVCCKQCICSSCFFRIQRKRTDKSAPCSFCKASLFEIVYDPTAQSDIEKNQESGNYSAEREMVAELETKNTELSACSKVSNSGIIEKKESLSRNIVLSDSFVVEEDEDIPFNPREVEIPIFLQNEGYTEEDLMIMEACFRSMRATRV